MAKKRDITRGHGAKVRKNSRKRRASIGKKEEIQKKQKKTEKNGTETKLHSEWQKKGVLFYTVWKLKMVFLFS